MTLAACGNSDASSSSIPDSAVSESTPEVAVAADKSADIVVIGAGGAGMTAAIQAAQDGATNVVIVEKMPLVGGNTTRATGGLNASETKFQKEKGIEDSNKLFVEDTLKGGKNVNDVELVNTMVENSADAVEWVNSIGGDLSDVGMAGGASVKRIHRPADTSAVGPMLVKTLSAKLEEMKIPTLMNTKADKILVDENGAVKGVQVTGEEGTYTINCKAVVLATGGFGANSEMVVKYKPELAGFGTTNFAGATGDGVVMAEELGAALVDIEQIQTHPTVNPETQIMYTEGVRGNGAILVNKEGKRFINELETRDVVSAAILAQTDKQAYLLFDQKVRDGLKAIETYISAGIVTEADTIEELAGKIGVDAKVLEETMNTYAGYQASGKDADFGRASMEEPLTTAKYYAAVCAPAVHHTMGGVKINTTAEVLKQDSTAIAGLFAAGEVVGGVHGANRLGGNAVTDIVVFGRIAGSSANKYIAANGGNTEPSIVVEEKTEEVKPEVQGSYKDGVYEGEGNGNNGKLTVEVTVEGGNIVNVALKSHTETVGIYEAAEKAVTENIIRKQTTEVDGVSGATRTADGIKEAVNNALKDAK